MKRRILLAFAQVSRESGKMNIAHFSVRTECVLATKQHMFYSFSNHDSTALQLRFTLITRVARIAPERIPRVDDCVAIDAEVSDVDLCRVRRDQFGQCSAEHGRKSALHNLDNSVK